MSGSVRPREPLILLAWIAACEEPPAVVMMEADAGVPEGADEMLRPDPPASPAPPLMTSLEFEPIPSGLTPMLSESTATTAANSLSDKCIPVISTMLVL